MQGVPETGPGAGGHRYDNASLIDVDSELIGISRKFTKCRPPITDVPHKQTIVFPDCTSAVSAESTRLTNGPCTLRDNGVNRFTPLCFDPQKTVNTDLPFHARVNLRLVVKDNHRPCIETPMDPFAAMPPGASDFDPVAPEDYALQVPDDISKYHYNPPSSIIAPCNTRYLHG